MAKPLRLFSCFHFNLSFSSIGKSERETVIQACYWPLLRLIEEQHFPVGIEVTGLTLEQIDAVDPEWIVVFKRLVEAGKCELIGSGYVQLIGPLVPSAVNHFNQGHGVEIYRRYLGVQPKIALVNEQAWSAGLIEHYKAAGYQSVIMEWDNAAEQHPEWPLEWRYHTQTVESDCGEQLTMLWNQSIQFQRFQRYVHGELVLEDFIEELSRHVSDNERFFALYGNDAEVFGYRPGRYDMETPLEDRDEWKRITDLVVRLNSDPRFEFVLPGTVIREDTTQQVNTGNRVDLRNTLFPIPVKKQRKYNIARWAVTGRDDLWLNTTCHHLSKALSGPAAVPDDRQIDIDRRICKLWRSDLRTHITADRWDGVLAEVDALERHCALPPRPVVNETGVVEATVDEHSFEESDVLQLGGATLRYDRERSYLHLETEYSRCTLNLFRGATFKDLSFSSHQFVPLIGTVPHGYFHEIELGADYFSGGITVDLPVDHKRITDLAKPDEWKLVASGNVLCFEALFNSDKGAFEKRIYFSTDREQVKYKVDFHHWTREQGVFRVGNFTLLPPFDTAVKVRTKNGGDCWEEFTFDEVPSRGVDHSRAVSALVSSTSGFGSPNGEIEMGHGGRAIRFQWDPVACALFPMIKVHKGTPGNLFRLIYSLSELDETWTEGGRLLPCSITLSPN